MIILGSADAPTIIGCGHKSPYRLWSELSGLVEPQDDASEIMETGKALESVVLGLFVARLGGTHVIWKEQPTTLHVTRPWQRATPDALLLRYDRATDVEHVALVEIKCVTEHAPSVPRVPWLIQCLHQRMVMESVFPEIERHYLVAFGGLRLAWWEVPRHQAAMDRVLREEERFLERIELEEPPPLRAEDAGVLHQLWPWSKPRTAQLPEAMNAASVAYAQGLEMVRVGETMRDTAQAEIKAAMQDAEAGVFPDGTRAAWRTGKDGRRRFRMTFTKGEDGE